MNYNHAQILYGRTKEQLDKLASAFERDAARESKPELKTGSSDKDPTTKAQHPPVEKKHQQKSP